MPPLQPHVGKCFVNVRINRFANSEQINPRLLQDKSEIRMVITKSTHLLLRQNMLTPAPLISPLILPLTTQPINETTHDSQPQKPNTNTLPQHKPRRRARQKDINRDDPPNIPKTNLPCRSDGAFKMPAEIGVEPADDDWHSGVGTGGSEEESAVVRCRA